MNRTLLISLAGAVVLSGSAAAYGVFSDDTVTVSAVCVPAMENDRDHAGLAGAIAVVTVDRTTKVTARDGYHESLSHVRVTENLKGTLPASLDMTQNVPVAPDGALSSAEDYSTVLRPGHQYLIGIFHTPGKTPDAWLSTAADGAALDTVRAHWKDAIAHQNPPRSNAKCTSDVIVK
ncbi:hypothetical protein [Streptomyces sp. NPDC091278]|uniref:hypothetical protein n=1 Tax=Streptomyces sp. NPDC091278 TaxID=3155301 RepID=UPI00344D16CD